MVCLSPLVLLPQLLAYGQEVALLLPFCAPKHHRIQLMLVKSLGTTFWIIDAICETAFTGWSWVISTRSCTDILSVADCT